MKLLKVSQFLFILGSLCVLSSCLVQTQNSVNGDAKAFQPLPANANAAFSSVHAIIQKNCATCHSNFASFAEADFISNKLVVPNHPEASEIFQNLKGSGVGNGEMPKNGAQLSTSDIAAFRTWITNMGNVAPTGPTTLFGQSQIVINNNCVSCHKEVSGLAEADFVTLGWVVPGNADASKLYYKLLGTDVTDEPTPDMPLKGNPLSKDDLSTLRQWMNQMTPADFPAPIIPANTAFGKVQKMIANNCVKCHESMGKSSESDFVTKGLISPGSATNSKLYKQLIGSIPTSSTSNMPEAGAPLTNEQLQDVEDWINGMPIPPTKTDLAVGQIRAAFETTIQPLVQRGCMDCHNSKATPDGFLGKLPIFKQIEEKHIVDASAILDFSQTFPNWSKQSEDPLFYLNEIQTVLSNGSMPPWDYKLVNEHNGGVLSPSETQAVLTWVTQSQSLLQAADDSKPTASKFFSQKCVGCHNSSTASGGFAFDDNGGEISVPTGTTKSGIPFVTKMDPGNSAVYLVLLADSSARKGLPQMPYKASGSDVATDAERTLISNWINQK